MADGEKVKREHLEGDRREEECAKDPGRQTIHRDPVGNTHDPAEIHNDVRDVVEIWEKYFKSLPSTESVIGS